MNAPLTAPPIRKGWLRRSAQARHRMPKVVCATLQVTGERACLVAELGRRRVWTFAADVGPRETFEQAYNLLHEAMADGLHEVVSPGDLSPAASRGRPQVRWRLVLPGGFHHLSRRPRGRWSPMHAQATAGELEPDCPLELDELIAASLPIGERAAWTVALTLDSLTLWHAAAADVGLLVEGVWTSASALVEYLLENPPSQRVCWSDGRVAVTVDSEEARDDHRRNVAELKAVRVTAARGEPCCTLTPPASTNDDAVELRAVTPEFYPALWAQSLRRVDPSESFNLARGRWAAPDLVGKRQRPFANACWWSAACCIVIGVAALLLAQNQRQRLASDAEQIRAVWIRHQGDVPQSALPVDALVKQLNAWRNLRERGMLGRRTGSELAQLARWTAALPADLVFSVDHVRSAGEEVWIDGQVKSQAEARRLFDALAAIPGVATDSMRTSPGAGGLVGFSLRLSLART